PTTHLPGGPFNEDPAVGPVFIPTARPFGGAQFRSPLRDINGMGGDTPAPGTYLSGPQTVLLRSLLAAVNAADLRDSDDTPTAVTVSNFPATVTGLPTKVIVQAYGLEKQPFITEVYANNFNGLPQDGTDNNKWQYPGAFGNTPNPNGYVAVQLYNPYETALDISNWSLYVLNRTSTNYPAMKLNDGRGGGSLVPLHTFAAVTIIQPRKYLLLENFGGPGDAKFRPWFLGPNANSIPFDTPPLGTVNLQAYTYDVPNLYQVMADPMNRNTTGGELFLTRPTRLTDGTAGM